MRRAPCSFNAIPSSHWGIGHLEEIEICGNSAAILQGQSILPNRFNVTQSTSGLVGLPLLRRSERQSQYLETPA